MTLSNLVIVVLRKRPIRSLKLEQLADSLFPQIPEKDVDKAPGFFGFHGR